MEEKLYLIYVERLNNEPNSMGIYEYDFFFSDTPETVWGEDWAEQCPSACESLRPSSELYSKVKRLYTIYTLKGAQENSCFSMQDCIDGCIALCWEDISNYDEYPEPIRLVFKFGESMESVEDKLAQRHQFFPEKDEFKNKEDDETEIDNL